MARDAQRAKVYAAEHFVQTVFDRAAARGNRVVEFFGNIRTAPGRDSGLLGNADVVHEFQNG